MDDLKIFKLRYFSGGNLAVSVVAADTLENAISILMTDYDVEFSDIEQEYEEIKEEGIVLTWHQPE